MKIYLLAAAAGLTGLVAWNLAATAKTDIDPVASGSIHRNTAKQPFTVANISAHSTCVVERGAAVTGRSHLFSAPKECDKVWPGLPAVRTWTQNEDGTVILSDAGGEAVLTVAEGDGVSYEVLEPAGLAMTFKAVR
ncbi:hypothetical protein MRS76_00705 [Rhizobiaceae bacterium n13]|uniref:Alkaline proteinase inhibitor/ Outer membrane lipoprotein Omp19 domain-containing protein n=1 Tax=Ferirhizobium litorale TaxID=2927786 RepID=A0AAE3Q7I6_9HYPH|nr:hypothetical protein [Fererhizobium litorale]MDI7860462.1 hypothetical protein [Fererhizobium litorale]MDI7920597.1 hypothetical protein [Fererhizobium litorale]